MPPAANCLGGEPAGRQAGLVDTPSSGGLSSLILVMIFVYAIKSLSKNYIYVGMTNDIERRLAEHNNGENRSTKAYKPFVLIYSEIFRDRATAREKEKYCKSGVGKEFLKFIANK